MFLAFATAGRALLTVARHIVPLIFANLIALLLSAPVLVALILVPRQDVVAGRLLFVLLVVVLPNPAAAGLHYMLHQYLQRDPYAGFSQQWPGFRQYALPALRLWLAALPVTVVIIANLVFYARAKFGAAPAIETLWIFVMFVWLGIVLYVYPLLMEQEELRMITTFRNAATITFARPFFTAAVQAIWLLLLALFALTVVPVTLIGLAVGGAIQQGALAALLPSFKTQPAERA